MTSSLDPAVESEINKRMTMNLLIQGGAFQTCLTAHHLVREELDGLTPLASRNGSNTDFYDRFSVCLFIHQWNSEIALLTGLPCLFWHRVGSGVTPFCRHPLLARFGKQLAKESKKQILARCKEKGVWASPVVTTLYATGLLMKARLFENEHHARLIELAKDIAHAAWGIDRNRLAPTITEEPEFGEIRTPRTRRGQMLRNVMVGWGGVRHAPDGKLYVVARSKFWGVLIHELCKGSLELISLHGLNQLDEDVYELVMEEADQIEFEVWMMQAGYALYRKVLAIMPRELSTAESLMYIAKMPSSVHERFMVAVIEQPDRARAMLREFSG